jgi:hypothetical protein
MSEFGSDEYWEQQQLEQLQWEEHQEELRRQEEQHYIEAMYQCAYIARGWLLGELSEEEAIDAMSYTGLPYGEEELLKYAQDALDME